MICAVIENGLVVNVLVVDSLDFMPNLVNGENARIGNKYENGLFIEVPIALDLNIIESVTNAE